MKISVIITTILVSQVSASFYDVFHGAVLSVQNRFGKLLSDVVTDVKETVDCTILAVEHVLSLSPDATTRYYDKCGTNKTDSVSEARQDSSLPKVEVTFNLPNNDEFLQKVIPGEIDGRINETLSKVLDSYKSHDNVLSIEQVLAKESEQLAGVSSLVKKELEKLTINVTTDLKNIDKQRGSQPSVDTILQEIKVLEKREQSTKNTSEANEIHRVIDQVLGKLDAIEATEATENVKLEEILKDLENNSNNSYVGLRHQFKEWKEEESRHLNEIKSKIDEHEKLSEQHHGSYNRHGSNVSSFQDKTFEDGGINDTVITSNSYFNIERLIGSEVIHPFESPTTVGSRELSRSDNLSKTPKNNNVTGDNTKGTIKNTTLSIVDSTPLNEKNQTADTTTESDKQQSFATREPTVTIFSINENNSNETVITFNPKQVPEIEDVKLNVESKIKELLSDTAKNNDTIIRSTAEVEVTPTSQNKHDLNNTVINNTGNAVVNNIFINVTNSDNISSTFSTNELVSTLTTFDDIKSHDAVMKSTLSSINFSSLVNKTIVPIETTHAYTDSTLPVGNVKSSEVTTIILHNSDDLDATKRTSRTILIINTPVSETIRPIESTTASSKENSTLQTVNNTLIREDIQTEESSISSSNYTMITGDSSPVVKNTTISQTIEPKENITTLGNEESSSASIVTYTSETISDSKPEENMVASENTDALLSTNLPKNSLNTLIDTDSDSITKAPFQLTEITTVSKSIDLVTLTVNEEPTVLTTKSAININEVKNENTDSITTVVSTTKNTESLKVETTTAVEKQNLSSTSTQSAINEIVTTSIAFPPTERIPMIENMASRNEDNLRNSPSVEANPFLRTTSVPDFNYSLWSTPLTVTQSPLVARKWPPPNKLNQENYNTNGVPGNSDRSLQTRQPLVNLEGTYKIPTYDQLDSTTHRPRVTEPRASNFKNPSMDYESFFHKSPRNSEAHQRALKEALQLMANSKRSNRIINNIMKNKNKFKARSIFNG